MFFTQALRRDTTFKAVQHAMAVLLLTSIHHVYGAYLYETPWRLHMVYVSGATILVMVASLALLCRSSAMSQRLGSILLGATVLGVPVLAIGGFEGIYNHLLKNILYFAGASRDSMLTLFPPPTYEMPNDLLFELTGILQVVPAAFTAGYLYRMTIGPRTKALDRRKEGEVVENCELLSISGEWITLPDPGRMIHLQFRRFAGCPVCNLHLQSVVRRQDELVAAGIREVVVFHSSMDELLKYESDLPFVVIADPRDVFIGISALKRLRVRCSTLARG